VCGDDAAAAVAGIDESEGSELIQGGQVVLHPITLVEHRSIPLQTERLECAQNRVGGARDLPWWIDILDSNVPLPIVMARLEITAEGGNEGPEVQWARRGGCEAAAIGRGAIHERLVRDAAWVSRDASRGER